MLKDIIEEYHKSGVTLLINSHDLNDIQDVVTHLAFLDKGVISCQGAYKDLLNNFIANRYKVVTRDPINVKRSLEKEDFVKSVNIVNNYLIIDLKGTVNELSDWMNKNNVGVQEMIKIDDNLLSLYKKMYSKQEE